MRVHELSLAQRVALDPKLRAELFDGLTEEEAEALLFEWSFHARPKQLAPPGDWTTWLILAGRGFGKTRTGAEWIIGHARSGKYPYLTLAGPTASDVRDAMVEGESGILAVSPPWFRPDYLPSKGRLEWPNGTKALLLSADEPDRFRGKQHMKLWADELAAWRYPDAWDQASLGLRIGDNPQACVTTTPRPTPMIKELVADPTTCITKGTTYENKGNLSAKFLTKVVAKYEGTRLGRQELNAEILDDTPGALWTSVLIERLRIRTGSIPDLRRTVVALDPSVAEDGGGDACGIVAAGLARCACKVGAGGVVEDHAFVLEDASDNLGPEAWASAAVGLYDEHAADRIVAEQNNGGALVKVTIGTVRRNLPVKLVHAAKGKRARAEPISALYEQGKVHHVGALPKLENEMTTWNSRSGAPSPNRMDALVWALTELMLEAGEPPPTPALDAGLGVVDSGWSI